MTKTLVVYNICGISGRENTRQYLASIRSIQDQGLDVDIVISSCMSSDKTLDELAKTGLTIIDVPAVYPVNFTFNNACRVLDRDSNGNSIYDLFVYLDSGITLPTGTLKPLIDENSDDFCMVASYVDDDMTNYWNVDQRENTIVPLGKAVNLHCQSFSRKFYEAFDRKLMPCIFAGHCSESVLTFMAAAVQSKWLVTKNSVVHHETNMDGQSSGFNTFSWVASTKRPTYIHPHRISVEEFQKRLISHRPWEVGLGYEEVRQVQMHNPDLYDKNDLPINPEPLKAYIRDYLFLAEFEYEQVPYRIINNAC